MILLLITSEQRTCFFAFEFSMFSMVPGLSDNHQVPVLTETKRRNGRYKDLPRQEERKEPCDKKIVGGHF